MNAQTQREQYTVVPAESDDLETQESCRCIADNKGCLIAIDVPKEYAISLVHRFNSHDELVEALKECEKLFQFRDFDTPIYLKVKQALLTAQKEG